MVRNAKADCERQGQCAGSALRRREPLRAYNDDVALLNFNRIFEKVEPAR